MNEINNEKKIKEPALSSLDIFNEMHDALIGHFKKIREAMDDATEDIGNSKFSFQISLMDLFSKETFDFVKSHFSIFVVAFDKFISWINSFHGLDYASSEGHFFSIYGWDGLFKIVVDKKMLDKVLAESYDDTDVIFEKVSMDVIDVTMHSLQEAYDMYRGHVKANGLSIYVSLGSLLEKGGHKNIIPELIRKNDKDFIFAILSILDKWLDENKVMSDISSVMEKFKDTTAEKILFSSIYLNAMYLNPHDFIEYRPHFIHLSPDDFENKEEKDLSLIKELHEIRNSQLKKESEENQEILKVILENLPVFFRNTSRAGSMKAEITLRTMINFCGFQYPDSNIRLNSLNHFLIQEIQKWCDKRGIEFKYIHGSKILYSFNWE